jgi:hypothetical protein
MVFSVSMDEEEGLMDICGDKKIVGLLSSRLAFFGTGREERHKRTQEVDETNGSNFIPLSTHLPIPSYYLPAYIYVPVSKEQP